MRIKARKTKKKTTNDDWKPCDLNDTTSASHSLAADENNTRYVWSKYLTSALLELVYKAKINATLQDGKCHHLSRAPLPVIPASAAV